MNILNTIYWSVACLLIATTAAAQPAKNFQKKTVIEEGTATWCGFCPRGIVAMKKATQQFPKNFIGISIHYNDPLATNDYPMWFTGDGLPSARINRSENINVESSEFINATRKQLTQRSPAKIEIAAEWVDLLKQDISVTLTAEFGKNFRGFINYSIIILEDSITGIKQHNYYANNRFGYAEGLEKEPEYYTPIFSDVVRAVYPKKTNPNATIAGEKIAYSPKAGTIKTKTITIPCPTNIRNKNHLRLVVLLLNSDNTILNADKTAYLKIRKEGILSTLSNNASFRGEKGTLIATQLQPNTMYQVYSPMGTKVYQGAATQITLPQGLYIITYEGSSYKILIQ